MVFGTRPDAIKMAPLFRELKSDRNFDVKVAVSAQHREMLDQVTRFFGIGANYDLNVMRERQDLFYITSETLSRLKGVLEKESPDIVLVQGDTTTTFVGALAAFYMKIPVGHVEAGLRTYDKYQPFPEEMNRRLVGALADLHFAPTETAKESLLREGVPKERVFVTGNTVIDALLWASSLIRDREFDELCSIDFSKKVILVTAHRRENWGEPMERIAMALREIARREDVEVVFPVHKNPVVRETVFGALGGLDNVHLLEPLEYPVFVKLLMSCYLILTDSGGIQEEAPSLGKPVLVMREKTERPEAVEAGVAKLVGTDTFKIVAEVTKLLDDEEEYERMAKATNPYGDGMASLRTKEAILWFFGRGPRPEDFSPKPCREG